MAWGRTRAANGRARVSAGRVRRRAPAAASCAARAPRHVACAPLRSALGLTHQRPIAIPGAITHYRAGRANSAWSSALCKRGPSARAQRVRARASRIRPALRASSRQRTQACVPRGCAQAFVRAADAVALFAGARVVTDTLRLRALARTSCTRHCPQACTGRQFEATASPFARASGGSRPFPNTRKGVCPSGTPIGFGQTVYKIPLVRILGGGATRDTMPSSRSQTARSNLLEQCSGGQFEIVRTAWYHVRHRLKAAREPKPPCAATAPPKQRPPAPCAMSATFQNVMQRPLSNYYNDCMRHFAPAGTPRTHMPSHRSPSGYSQTPKPCCKPCRNAPT